MKSIKLKAIFLAGSFFALAASYAQDSTHKPKPDTSNVPKHDSTTMITPGSILPGSGMNTSHLTVINSALTTRKDRFEAKKESMEG